MKSFGCRAWVRRAANAGPASESLQGKNPRGMISKVAAGAMGISGSWVASSVEANSAKQGTAVLRWVAAVMAESVGACNREKT